MERLLQNCRPARIPTRVSGRSCPHEWEREIQMTMKFWARTGASIAAMAAALTVTPALADSSMEAGPVTVTLGGFLAFETIYRSRNENSDMGSQFNAVPFSSSPYGHLSET